MPDDREEKEPAFKVVDRRRFIDGNESRAESPIKASEDELHQRSPKKKDNPGDEKTAGEPPERPPISFSLFVQSLAHQAMMGLGMAPWPDSGLIRQELVMAKEMIDILVMLKDKSAGNLNAEEQSLMDTILYQLRLSFVEITKKPLEDTGSIIK